MAECKAVPLEQATPPRGLPTGPSLIFLSDPSGFTLQYNTKEEIQCINLELCGFQTWHWPYEGCRKGNIPTSSRLAENNTTSESEL